MGNLELWLSEGLSKMQLAESLEKMVLFQVKKQIKHVQGLKKGHNCLGNMYNHEYYGITELLFNCSKYFYLEI